MTTALSAQPPPPTTRPHRLGRPAQVNRSRRADELVAQLRSCTSEDDREDLRQELIALNMPVARAIAAKYRHRGIPAEDLEQIAYLALTRAARRFDPDAGHAFLSFCVPTMRGEVRRYFRDHGWMVRPPRRIQELQPRVTRAQSELVVRLGRPPAAREVAQHLEEDVDDVLEAMDAQGAFTPASLDTFIGDGDTTLGDLLTADPVDELSAEARMMLGPAVRRLGDRDRHILQRRFFDGLSQRQIAEELGTTQMQVSRWLTRIFEDLRETLGPLAGA